MATERLPVPPPLRSAVPFRSFEEGQHRSIDLVEHALRFQSVAEHFPRALEAKPGGELQEQQAPRTARMESGRVVPAQAEGNALADV